MPYTAVGEVADLDCSGVSPAEFLKQYRWLYTVVQPAKLEDPEGCLEGLLALLEGMLDENPEVFPYIPEEE